MGGEGTDGKDGGGGSGQGLGGDLKAQSLALLAWLAVSVRPAEAWVFCIREPSGRQGPGAPWDKGVGSGFSYGSELGPLLAVDLAIGVI